MLTLKSIPGIASNEYMCRFQEFAGLNMKDDDFTMGIEESPEAYNVSFRGGVLSRAEGCDVPKWTSGDQIISMDLMPSEVKRLFSFEASDLTSPSYKNVYAVCEDDRIYRFCVNGSHITAQEIPLPLTWENGEITYFTEFTSAGVHYALVGGPDTRPYVYTENDSITVPEMTVEPKMRRCVMHYSRMFGIGGTGYEKRIWFSSQGNPTNFNTSIYEGGYIDLSDGMGAAGEIISFFDKLYVFCRFGIVCINAVSEQNDFSVENVYFSDGEILPDSVCACGQEILFATRDGVFSFNGVSVSSVSEKISGFFIKQDVCRELACSAFYRGNYYLSLMTALNGVKKRYLLIFDTNTGKWNIGYGANIISMAVCRDVENERFLVSYDGSTAIDQWGTGDYYDGDILITAGWKSPLNDFGSPNCIKRIKEVHFCVQGSGKLGICVEADGKRVTKRIDLSPTMKHYRIDFDISGYIAGIRFFNEYGGNFRLSPPAIVYSIERDMMKR